MATPIGRPTTGANNQWLIYCHGGAAGDLVLNVVGGNAA